MVVGGGRKERQGYGKCGCFASGFLAKSGMMSVKTVRQGVPHEAFSARGGKRCYNSAFCEVFMNALLQGFLVSGGLIVAIGAQNAFVL